MHTRIIWLLGLLLCTGTPAWGRGGGGCFQQGSLIQTPTGDTPVEQLARGDIVSTLVHGRLQSGTVEARVEVTPSEYWELHVGGRTLRVTGEHPIQIGPGAFRCASRLQPGDLVQLWDRGRLQAVALNSLRRVQAVRPAYNLLVMPGGIFVANGIAVHNKGCFLPDTPILRGDGSETSISAIRPGDDLLAFTAEGGLVHTTVNEVLTHDVDDYAVVTTEDVTLRVTLEHPFYMGDGTFKTLEALQVGDRIYAYDGHGLTAQTISSISRVCGRTRVYNLQTDAPHTFFANGIAVHNKGGGGFGGGGFHGGSYGGGGGSGGDAAGAFFGFIILCVIVVLLVNAANQRKKDENLDFVYDANAVAPKAVKTQQLLTFIAKTDPTFARETLERLAQSTFVTLQQCWEAREYGPMKPLLMPNLYAEHCAELGGMLRSHEINRIQDLKVERVDIVNVRYTHQENQREFTALLTASARDYYVDDRTREFLRGDEAPARFQEFWTFHRQDGGWLLREIEQTRESDALKQENFFEPFTDQGLQQVYAETASPGGPAGPWVEEQTETKATRIERLLNFLVQTDKLWNRDAMIERARKIFTDVFLARQASDPASVPVAELFPDVAAHLQAEITQRQTTGTVLEFRNFCVRKVDLVLVRNFKDNRADEFTACISAHAQRIVRRQNLLLSQDEYVSPFVEFWTFGRLDDEWKLKEALPPARGQQAIAQENVDDESSREQLQWYYQKTRAT